MRMYLYDPSSDEEPSDNEHDEGQNPYANSDEEAGNAQAKKKWVPGQHIKAGIKMVKEK